MDGFRPVTSSKEDQDFKRAQMANAAMRRYAREEVADQSTPEMLGSQWAGNVSSQIESMGERLGVPQAAAAVGRATEGVLPDSISKGLQGFGASADASADTTNRLDNARQSAAYEQYGDGIAGRLGRGAMGTAQQLPVMFGSGAVGGLPGMVATFSAQAGNQAYTEALDAGLSEDDAMQYAGRAAAIEGGITTAFSLAGAGGVEDMITGVRRGAIKQAAKPAIRAALRKGAKNFSAELAEEISIEVLSNVDRAMSGVDPTADEWSNQLDTAIDTAIQTAMTMGAVKGSQVGMDAINNVNQQIRNDFVKPGDIDPAALDAYVNQAQPNPHVDGDLTTEQPSGVEPTIDRSARPPVDFHPKTIPGTEVVTTPTAEPLESAPDDPEEEAPTEELPRFTSLATGEENTAVRDMLTSPSLDADAVAVMFDTIPPTEFKQLSDAIVKAKPELADAVSRVMDELTKTPPAEPSGETPPVDAPPEPTRPTMGDYKADISYGDMVSAFREGDVPTNNAGRKATSPYPKIDTSTPRKAKNTIKRVDKWLHNEALAEAQARGDSFNQTQFGGLDPKKLSQGDRDSLEAYLFDPEGNQPVPRSPLDDIGETPFDKKVRSATAVRQDPSALESRVREAKGVLNPQISKGFGKGVFNFDEGTLTGDNGYVLRWKLRDNPDAPESYENQQTNRGIVVVEKPKTAPGQLNTPDERGLQPNHEQRKRGEKEAEYEKRLSADGWNQFQDSPAVSSYASPDLQNAQDIKAMSKHRKAGLKVGERVTVADSNHAIGGVVQTEGGLNHADILLDNGKRFFAGGENIHYPERTDLTTPKKTLGNKGDGPLTPDDVSDEDMRKAIIDAIAKKSGSPEQQQESSGSPRESSGPKVLQVLKNAVRFHPDKFIVPDDAKDLYTWGRKGNLGHVMEVSIANLDRFPGAREAYDRYLGSREAEGAESKPKTLGDKLADKQKAAREEADAKWAKVKDRLKDLNTGVNPEVAGLIADATIAEVRAGTLKFAAFAVNLNEKLGPAIVQKYASAFEEAWQTVKDAFGFEGMEDSGKLVSKEPAQEPKSIATEKITLDKTKSPSVAIADFLFKGGRVKNIGQIRSALAEHTGGDYSPGTTGAKEADEITEVGVVLAAQRIINNAKRDELSEKEVFDKLVDLYNRQPNLSVRTTDSSRLQAFSTPVPLAYLAAVEAGVTPSDVVYDPSAGNGALLIGAKKRIANELMESRATALTKQGIPTTVKDATEFVPDQDYNVVITNPPFGKDPDNKKRTWTIDGGKFSELDHVIALKALENLPEDGRAVLIVGSKGFEQSKPKPDQQRASAYSNKNQKAFWDQLYGNYNVTDHYTVGGSLYARQGAKFPVDVIVINGKGKSSRPVPYNFIKGGLPKVLESWKELSDEKIERLGVRGDAESGNDREGDSDTPEAERDGSDVGPSPEPVVSPPGVDRPAKPAGKGAVREGVGDETGRDADDRGKPSRPRNDPSVSGDTDGGRSTPNSVPNEGDADSRGSGTDRAESGSDAVPKRDQLDASEHQAKYEPSSNLESVDTLVPVNHQAAVAKRLEDLADIYGQLDMFVASELGYDPDTLGEYFAAEQVDALAMAIASHKEGKGFVNGDMTGVGKGRFAAGMLVYAKRNGMVPVFITEKPSLFADMMRDLTDIDQNSEGKPYNPLITNSLTGDDKIDLHAQTKFGERVASQGGDIAKRRAMEAVEAFSKEGSLKANYAKKNAKNKKIVEHDAIFSSYSQMQTTKGGKETWRHDFFRSVAPNAFFVLDESHNAGGGAKPLDMNGEEIDQSDKLPMSEFVREVINGSKGTVFASATFAKRPEVMSLYAITGIADAMNDVGALEEIIVKGGVPMQQVLSEMMVENGRYLRREKSYKGVEMKPRVVEVDGEMLDEISGIFRGIQDFDIIKNAAINKKDGNGHSMVDHIVSGGGKLGDDNAIGKKGIDSTTFSSKLWNLVDQMLLASKAEAVAEEAIATIKRGESPVIAVDKTMEASLRQFLEDNPALDGEPIDYSMKTLYRNYLERTRELLIKHDKKDPDSWERVYLTDAQIGEQGVEAYKAALELIDNMQANLPASPIDMIRQRIEEAGYSVAEITGRKYAIDYSNGETRMGFRPDSETGNEGKLATVNAFNGNNLDVVILNRSGSTGLSIHASEKFANQKRRHMIIAEASKNIDTFMQTLGRTHRTGQITEHEGQPKGSNLPYYSLLMTDAPAEIRVASVMARKLASLNANVTASAKGDVSFDVPDIINVVGDAVVLEHLVSETMNENNLFASLDVKEPEGESVPPGFAKKVTGRVALLPLEEQHQFWDDVTRKYEEKIDQLDRLNANPLSAATLDLDAVVEESTKIFDGEDSNNAFAQPAYLEQIDARKKIDLMQPEEIDKEIEEALDGKERQHWKEKSIEEVEKLREDYVESKRGKLKDATFSRMVEGTMDRARSINSAYRRFQPGSVVVINDNSKDAVIDRSVGIVLNVRRVGRSKDPTALGAWEVVVAAKDSRKKIRIPLTKLGSKSGYELFPSSGLSLSQAKDKFADESVEGREKRFIGTGNILAAFEELKDGHIVFFTDRKGETRRGVLMPRSFNAERWAKQRPVVFDDVKQAIQFMKDGGGMLTSPDKAIQAGIFGDQLVFRSPKSRSRSGQYTTNKKLTSASKSTFVTKGQIMEMVVPTSSREAALNALFDLTPMQTALEKDKDFARQIKGEDQNLRRGRDRSTNQNLGETPEMPLRHDRVGFGTKKERQNVLSPNEIITKLESLFGVPIRRANFSGGALGIYKIASHVVRLAGQGPNDIAVATHEVAHHIDNKLGITGIGSKRPRDAQLNNHLAGIDYEPDKARPSEGFAEFIRMYVTIPEALQQDEDRRYALKWFDSKFKESNPEAYAKVRTARDLASRYTNQSAMERAHSAITTYSEMKRKARNQTLLSDRVEDFKSRMMVNVVDKFHGLKMLQDMGEEMDFDYSEAESAYEYAAATNRSAMSHAERAFKEGVHRITEHGRQDGEADRKFSDNKGIRNIMERLSSVEFDELGAYLHARITLFDTSHKTGLDPRDAREIINNIESDPGKMKKFEQARTDLAEFNNDLIRMATDAGLFTAEEMAAMFDAYEKDGVNEYVPLLRVRPGRSGGGLSGNRLSVPTAVYGKSHKGSDDPIIHPFHATLQRAIRIYDAANRQQLIMKIVEEARQIEGSGRLVEKIDAGKKPFTFQAEEILSDMVRDGFIPDDRARALKIADDIRHGIVVNDTQTDFLMSHFDADLLDDAMARAPKLETLYTLWRPDWPISHTNEKIMRVVRNGQIEYYHVHPMVATAVRDMSAMQRGIFLRTVSGFTRFFKSGATALNTGFGSRQIFMDAETAMIQGREVRTKDIAKSFKHVGRAFAAAMKESYKSEVQKLYEEYGGTLTHALKADEASMKSFVENPSRSLGQRAKSSMRHPIQNATEFIAQYVATGDLGPRLAEFEATLRNYGYAEKKGKIIDIETGEQVTPPRYVLIRAVNAASDITYNYRRMGRMANYIEPLFPFTNAAIQSMDKFFRTILSLGPTAGKHTGSLEPLQANRGKKADMAYNPWEHRRRVMTIMSLKMSALVAMALFDGDDDDNEEEKTFGKYRALEYGTNGVTRDAIPHSREWSIVYGAMEAALDKYVLGVEETDFMRAFWTDMQMRAPSYASGLLGAAYGTISNTDPFFGGEIEPSWMEQAGIPDVEKTDERVQGLANYTAKVDRAVANQIAKRLSGTASDGVLSPKQYDFIFNQLSGGLYRRLGNTIGRAKEGELGIKDIPFVAGIHLNKHEKKSIGQFYDRMRELQSLDGLDERGYEEMTGPEKSELVRLEDYQSLMSEFFKEQRGLTSEEKIIAGDRLIVGLAREALGKEPMDSNPSPLSIPKSQWPEHLRGAAYDETVKFIKEKQDLRDNVRAPKTGQNLESRKASYAARKAEAVRWLESHSDLPIVQGAITESRLEKAGTKSGSSRKRGFSRLSL